MKLAGRVSILTLVVCAAVLVGGAIVLLLTVGDSPETAAQEFLSALAKGDVDSLTKLSYMGDEKAEQVKSEWTFAVDAGKYYRFAYQMLGSNQSDPKDAAVQIKIIRNLGKPASYDENKELPMVKFGGQWLVDVRSMDNELYPALPR